MSHPTHAPNSARPWRSRRCACAVLGLAGLLLLAGGLPLGAMLPRTTASEEAGLDLHDLVSLAGLPDHGVIGLLKGVPCTSCGADAGQAACGHARLPVLFHCHMGSASKASEIEVLQRFPNTSYDRMAMGPDNSVYVSNTGGVIYKFVLEGGREGWSVRRGTPAPVLLSAQREKLGLPAGALTGLAVGPGGELVLAYACGVAWLPRTGGECAPEQVRWLVGSSRAGTEAKAAAGSSSGAAGETKGSGDSDTAAMAGAGAGAPSPAPARPDILVAVGEDGTVYAAVPLAKAVRAIHPNSGSKGETIFTWKGDAAPTAMAVRNGKVHLVIRQSGKANEICTLIPQEPGRPYLVSVRVFTREFSPALGVFGDGRLIVGKPEECRIRLVSATAAAAPAAGARVENKVRARLAKALEASAAQTAETKAAAAADAARDQLVKEEESKDLKEAQKEKRKRKRRAQAAHRAEAAAAPGGQGSPGVAAAPAAVPTAGAGAPAAAGGDAGAGGETWAQRAARTQAAPAPKAPQGAAGAPAGRR